MTRWRTALPVVGLVLGLGILVAVALLAYQHLTLLDDEARWISHTHEVLESADALVFAVRDAGGARRMFAVTGDEAALGPYRSALGRIAEARAELRRLTGDNPAQLGRLDQLERAIDARLAQIDAAIQDQRAHGATADRETRLATEGKLLSDRVNALAGDIETEERGLLVSRHAAYGAQADSVRHTMVVGFAASAIILLLAFLQARRDAARRRDLERFRDEYVGYVFHDLKNPLSTLSLQARLLARQLDTSGSRDEKHAIRVIMNNAAAIDRLLRELLEMAYIESEHMELHTVPVALAGFVASVVERTVSTPDQARVRVEILGSSSAAIEARRIERVVANFIQNALKYAPASSPIIVRLERRADRAIVSVLDHGPGVAPADRALVFEKYKRTAVATAQSKDGLGLGLYISRKIVQAHGGEIGVRDAPGGGAAFYFELPAIADALPAPAPATGAIAAPAAPPNRLHGLRVLVVDDAINAVSALSELLGDEGLEVAATTSGETALAAIASRPVDAAVIDVKMPGMGGLELLDRLRAQYPGLPVVIMTGYPESKVGLAEARMSGDTAYIAKPVDVDELLRILERIVAVRPARPAQVSAGPSPT